MEETNTCHIDVSSAADAADCDLAQLIDALQYTLRRHGSAHAVLSVALVDDAQMADLNERHLGHAGPTDVLSFDLAEGGHNGGRRTTRGIEGEIVVSVDTARREAARRGHSVDAELALYAIHGTLHLLGYDDTTPHGAARMHEEENQILRALGHGPVFGDA